MSFLFLDLETIPDQRPGAYDKILENVTAPGNYKKQESIDRWIAQHGEAEAQEQYHKTGLNGIAGEICSIAWAIDDGEIIGYTIPPSLPEAGLLDGFFKDVQYKVKKAGTGAHPSLTWIGHNVIDFDLRFLKQRCIVNQVQPPFIIPADARHGSRDVFDTMKAWAGWKGYVSQQALCEALGIEGKDDMTGADVWPAYQAGKFEEILAYNKNDVRIVRELYRRMSWA